MSLALQMMCKWCGREVVQQSDQTLSMDWNMPSMIREDQMLIQLALHRAC